ncbi:MAG TPA: hypothetical protein VF599_22840 [Pyrinomonadaceae bacterium]
MKKTFRVFASLILALIICFQTSVACTADIQPLRKEFRRAESAFVGRIIKISEYYAPSEQKKKNHSERLERGLLER